MHIQAYYRLLVLHFYHSCIKRSTMNRIGPEFVSKAYALCRQYLKGAWATLQEDEFQVEVLSGTGISNYLFVCSIRNNKITDLNCPTKVLLHITGEIPENPEITLIETVTCVLLAERKIAPKVYGTFYGGRIEEYIPSRNLLVEEIREENFSTQIAGKLARFHSMDLPLQKEPVFLLDSCVRWLNTILDEISFNNPVQDAKFRMLLSMGLEQELEYIAQVVDSTPSPSVFCHNDLNEGNILLVDGETKGNNIMFIDFEYSSYNYRAFDIANHFCEWTFDYTLQSEPYYTYDPRMYPSIAEQLVFVREYLRNYSDEYEMAPEVVKVSLESGLLTEVKRFALTSHIFWALRSIIHGKRSCHKFGYLDYALTRMNAYKMLKQELVAATSCCDLGKMTFQTHSGANSDLRSGHTGHHKCHHAHCIH